MTPPVDTIARAHSLPSSWGHNRHSASISSRNLKRFSCTLGIFSLLLFTCPAFSEVDPLLEFIAAQQKSTREIYDSLSFKAKVRTKTEEEFTPELFDTTRVYDISRRGNSLLITRETSTAIEKIPQQKDGKLLAPIIKVIDMPTVMRLLFSDEFVANWNDISHPVVSMYTAEIWKSTPEKKRQDLMALQNAADPGRYCFGLLTPFYELLEHHNKFTTWNAREDEHYSCHLSRTLHLLDGTEKNDLSMIIDTRHGVLLSAEFRPGDSTTTCDIVYAELTYKDESILVPRTFHSVTIEPDLKIIEETHIEFFDVHDESGLPPHELTSMELPDGTIVQKLLPSGEAKTFSWLSGELLESPKTYN